MKTPRKLKPMKRLPNNWADNLWDSDLDAILQHWQDRLVYYCAPVTEGLFTSTRRGSDEDIRIVERRIAMWSECLRARQHGQKIMPILRAYR